MSVCKLKVLNDYFHVMQIYTSRSLTLGHVLCKFLGHEYPFSKAGLSSGFAIGIPDKTVLTDVKTVVLYQKMRELLNACVHA